MDGDEETIIDTKDEHLEEKPKEEVLEEEVVTEETGEPDNVIEPDVEDIVSEDEGTEGDSEDEDTDEDSVSLEDIVSKLKEELSAKEKELQETLSKLDEIKKADETKQVEELSANIIEKELELGKEIEKEERLAALKLTPIGELTIMWNSIKDFTLAEAKKDNKTFGRGMVVDGSLNVEKKRRNAHTIDEMYRERSGQDFV